MDRATRTSNLLGTYLTTNQSTSVPGSSSYSTIRSGQYLDPPTYSSARRGSNISDDGYSRSPSRYSSRYTGLDDEPSFGLLFKIYFSKILSKLGEQNDFDFDPFRLKSLE